MPTVLLINGYRLFFYSADNVEPMHVHVEKGDGKAKFWLRPIALASSYKMHAKDLKETKKIIEENCTMIEEKWNEFFSKKK